MVVSKNNGTPKSSILIGFSTINHPFSGTPIFGNTHMYTLHSHLPPLASEVYNADFFSCIPKSVDERSDTLFGDESLSAVAKRKEL